MMQLLLSIILAAASMFTIARAPYTYHFPRDHFAHDAYRTEWWYFTGHLRARDGHRFGYEVTFFRFGLFPHSQQLKPGESRWRSAQLYPAHFALTDETARTFVFDEKLARDALGQGAASERALDVHVGQWRLTAAKGALMPAMRLVANNESAGVRLLQTPQKPPAIHGRGGISRKGPCASCASHYYSFTRLSSSGTVFAGARTYRVNGISWMDHEYGSDELTSEQAGWDWFSLQLDDGREVMLYRLRRRDGGVSNESSGSLIARGGAVRYLALRAFDIRTLGWWQSPHTNARYPAQWKVRVAGIASALLITPTIADQELVDPRGALTYWEGSVSVKDAQTQRPLGVGYVELTGYAQPLHI
ncbi:MAG TPA: lipocalin-like domain-containing protein [Candidatus Baltobacteraceae bacterium]|jgi:predicted secreted hydrolase|nr:lipocalin-like domain-containing protein [Candidatus Baltobacteraceae bacterium]